MHRAVWGSHAAVRVRAGKAHARDSKGQHYQLHTQNERRDHAQGTTEGDQHVARSYLTAAVLLPFLAR